MRDQTDPIRTPLAHWTIAFGAPNWVFVLRRQHLFAAAGLTPRTALRTTKSPAEELGLTDPSISDGVIFEAMLKHPILVNRPIVCTEKGVALCRPSEAVFKLLDVAPGATYTKEDGDVITMPKKS